MHIYYKFRFSLLTSLNLRDIIEMKKDGFYCQKRFSGFEKYMFLFRLKNEIFVMYAFVCFMMSKKGTLKGL